MSPFCLKEASLDFFSPRIFSVEMICKWVKNRANLEKDSCFVLRYPGILEVSDDFQLMVISVFVSADWQSAEQAWIASSGAEQSLSLRSTGDVTPTPEEPASRGALNWFFF